MKIVGYMLILGGGILLTLGITGKKLTEVIS